MSFSRVRLVCFDLGGVLLRICRTWREGCHAAGLDVRGDWGNGYPQANGWHDLGVQFGTGCIDGRTWTQSISREINGLYSPEEITAVHHSWILGEYERVGEVIDRIHAAGLTTAALSNTNADHWETINGYAAVRKLHHRFASHLLRLHKPDPAIYRALEDRVNCRGSEILFFDDLPENVHAAQDVGWSAIQVNPHACTATQIEDTLRQYSII